MVENRKRRISFFTVFAAMIIAALISCIWLLYDPVVESLKVDKSDALYDKAYGQLKVEERDFITATDGSLNAIRVHGKNYDCIMFYANKNITFSENIPLYCFSKHDGKNVISL